MFCKECGNEVRDNAAVCMNCGVATSEIPGGVVQTSGKAIASLVCSLAGIFMCIFVGQILGLVFGYNSKKEIRASQGKLTGEGLATAGIIIGWIGIVLDILLILFWGTLFGSAIAEL